MSVIIAGREMINRAVHGDTVAVQILPKDQWRGEDDSLVMEEDEDEEEDDEKKKKDGDEKEVRMDTSSTSTTTTTTEKKPTGKVAGIIKRNWRPYCGTIDKASVNTTTTTQSTQSVFFWAFDKRIPKIRIRTRQAEGLMGKRIVVAIDGWSANSKYPQVRGKRGGGDKEEFIHLTLLTIFRSTTLFIYPGSFRQGARKCGR